MAIPVKNNFCIAPFTQLTFSPLGHTSPCAEIGGQTWNFENKPLIKIWQSKELQSLRNSFANNEKNSICNRCWNQEHVRKKSLRQRLFIYPHLKENLSAHLNSGNYFLGPRQINLIVGNICNLRCRICSPTSSVTYNVEGKIYNEKFGKNVYFNNQGPIKFSDVQIKDIFDISSNLQRIEFYGGEPLLDLPTLDLLDMLVKSGKSSNISLFYNTNGTNLPSERQIDLWNQFKSIEFNFSVDDIFDRFNYQRHPANYEEVISNVKIFKKLNWKIPNSFYFICTVSVYNVFYVIDILNELEKYQMPCFLNEITFPDYFNIYNLPKIVKEKIIDNYYKHPLFDRHKKQIEFLIEILKQDGVIKWDSFKLWTNAMDEYRNEKFQSTFFEFYRLLKDYDATF